jgi:multidrug efflux pump
LGIALVGGLLLSTFLTLFVVPAVYTYLSRHKVSAAEKYAVKETDFALED